MSDTTNIGKLFLNNKLFNEKAEIEYVDDLFNNKQKSGSFKLDYLSADFLNHFHDKRYKFKFYDGDNNIYLGYISGWSEKTKIYSRNYRLKFYLSKKQQQVKYRTARCKKLVIYFAMPFCQLLCRDIKLSYGYNNEYLIKYNSEPIILSVNNISIVFDDVINFSNIHLHSGTTSRFINPSISINFNNSSKLIRKLNEIEKIMSDVMIILTFYFNHKMDWYSYHAELQDNNGKLFEFLNYKDYDKVIGTNYEYDDPYSEFNKYINSEIINKLISKYQSLSKRDRETIKSFINDLAKIKDINSRKSRSAEILFLIESICDFLINKYNIRFNSDKGYSNYQEKIKSVVNYYKINNKEIKFSYANIKTKLKLKLWHITYYRNIIAHSDNKSNFNTKRLETECIKILKLIRILLFIFIEPKYKDIPYPQILI